MARGILHAVGPADNRDGGLEPSGSSSDQVKLKLPATPESLRLARLAASVVANRAGFGLDELDEFCLAVDELCYALVDCGDRTSRLAISFWSNGGDLHMQASLHGGHQVRSPSLSWLAEAILKALADEHRLGTDSSGLPEAFLRKRRSGW
jgi:hypothetical protein